MVVDDESGVLRFVSVSLSLADYNVITITSGEEGLKLVESAKPDVMLLDLVMTPLTGYDVLEKLRVFSRLPVIVFTARSDAHAQVLKDGANCFITKPFGTRTTDAKNRRCAWRPQDQAVRCLLTPRRRHRKEESRALAFIGLHPDSTPMSFYKDTTHSKSQTCTLGASVDFRSQTLKTLEKSSLVID